MKIANSAFENCKIRLLTAKSTNNKFFSIYWTKIFPAEATLSSDRIAHTMTFGFIYIDRCSHLMPLCIFSGI